MSLRTLSASSLVTVLSLSALTPAVSAASFSDVASTHPHAEAIAYVKAEGIVDGYADGTFRPNQTINRAEFTKIILEATQERARCASASKTFSDVPRDAWYALYVCRAKELGIVGGYPDVTFRPGSTINFAEAAKIIAQAQGLLSISVGPSVWYRGSVEELAERKAIPVSIDSFEKKITRGEMAEMIWRLKAGITTEASRTYHELETAAESQVYHNTRHGFSLTFPKNYFFTINEMTNNDATNASSITLVPNSVNIDVSPGPTFDGHEVLKEATGKTIAEFATVYAEFQQMSNTKLKFTTPERTELNGTASYRYRKSWTVDDPMGMLDYAADCYVMENTQREKIVLCQYSTLPVGRGDVTVASEIAHSFTITR